MTEKIQYINEDAALETRHLSDYYSGVTNGESSSTPITLAEPQFRYNGDVMPQRFIKFIVSEEAIFLQRHYPNATLLLMYIAQRARRISGKPDGLEIGEALIGDYENAGIESERKYRTAKKILIERAHIRIIETCRNRKKSTTGTTTKGTKVKLLRSDIWDINSEGSDHQNDDRATTERRPSDDEQERIRKNKNNNKDSLRSSFCSEPRKGSAAEPHDSIQFSFSEQKFSGISDDDFKNWLVAYPGIDHRQEITRAEEWVKSNASKAKLKKKWRKFLTNWFSKASERAVFTSANLGQRQVMNLEDNWAKDNRDKFFNWKKDNPDTLRHMEYRNGYVLNARDGKELSVKMNPDVFSQHFINVAGVRSG